MKAVAYNPTLVLIDSYVGAYKIYTLTNPINNDIFYVGQTMKNLSERLAGHINETGGSNRDKILYIKNILESGQKPIIQEVETIHVRCYIDKASVNEREAYWIKYYKGIGCKLLNIANPKNYDYQEYLSCLKNGETKWHFYYCGRTVSGINVYDERKLNADGFSFPKHMNTEDYSAQRVYKSEGYNPWKNERFIKKNGYRIDPYDEMSYVPCYNDMNPNYYDDDY